MSPIPIYHSKILPALTDPRATPVCQGLLKLFKLSNTKLSVSTSPHSVLPTKNPIQGLNHSLPFTLPTLLFLGLLTASDSQWPLPERHPWFWCTCSLVATSLCFFFFGWILPWFPNLKRALDVFPHIVGPHRVQDRKFPPKGIRGYHPLSTMGVESTDWVVLTSTETMWVMEMKVPGVWDLISFLLSQVSHSWSHWGVRGPISVIL